MPTITLAQRNAELDAHNAKILKQFALESDDKFILSERHTTTAGGDGIKLRGIPAIGRGVSGAIYQTKPGWNL